ncbi:MAG: aminotransferase class III-fold pyridoxal phosphate-dependent enzyme, partial [Gammaproteobacteria bacterium]
MQESPAPGLSAADLNFDPPRFPVDALQAALRLHYGLEGALTALEGERDQNHRVDCADGRQFVLKVSALGEEAGAVDFQIGALLHLEHVAPELPVPRITPSLAGNTRESIRAADGRTHLLRLLSWLPGEQLGEGEAIGAALFRNAAAFQAGLAKALSGYFHPHARHFVAWDIQRALVLDPGVQAHVQGDALALTADFRARLASDVLPRLPGLRAQVVHADGHTGNLLRSSPASEDIAGVIDFGDMVHAPLAQDIAVTIASFIRHGGMRFDNALLQLSAYNAVFPLQDEELELLHDLVMLRVVTALFMYDFRAATVPDPPAWIAAERPDIVAAFRLLDGIPRAEALARYRAACGRASARPMVPAEELLARREKVLGPSYRLFYREPVQLVRGEGVWLYDADGRRYLDGYNNVASVGHCHPHVVAALASQAATLNTHTRYLHESVVRYAERLTATMPAELSVCLLVCTGTEANDLAIRIARTVSAQEGVIVSEES